DNPVLRHESFLANGHLHLCSPRNFGERTTEQRMITCRIAIFHSGKLTCVHGNRDTFNAFIFGVAMTRSATAVLRIVDLSIAPAAETSDDNVLYDNVVAIDPSLERPGSVAFKDFA